jgi:hypothetical protein
MAKQRGQIITRYEIAALSGKAYLKSMTPSNIISAFKKCGIFPFDSSVVPEELLFPSRSFPKKKISEAEESSPTMQELLSQKMMDTAPKVKSPKVRSKKPKLGGKCITSAVVQEVEEYELSRKKPSQVNSKTKKCEAKLASPKPSTSGCQQVKPRKKLVFDDDDDESDFDNEDDDDKCCVCNLFSPPGLKECNDVVIVKWAECTKCGHWCHLRFCSAVKVVRRLGEFLCPHCC